MGPVLGAALPTPVGPAVLDMPGLSAHPPADLMRQYRDLLMCKHEDGTVHPVHPYPDETSISVQILDELDRKWRDPADTDVLVFADDCRYLVCEYLPERHAFALSRIP